VVEICFHKVTGKAQERHNRRFSACLSNDQLASSPYQWRTNLSHEGYPVIWISIHIPQKNISSQEIQPQPELKSLGKEKVGNENQLWCCACVPMTNADSV